MTEQERISVFDIFKIGIGPSSSHTMGPWKAAQLFCKFLQHDGKLTLVNHLCVELFGSLAKTGKGHGTDAAVILGLSGFEPETIAVEKVDEILGRIARDEAIRLAGSQSLKFLPEADILFHTRQTLPFHANALSFTATLSDGAKLSRTYYSTGGGFVVEENTQHADKPYAFPYPIDSADDLEKWCTGLRCCISDIVLKNELAISSQPEIEQKLQRIWQTMLLCMYRGCHAHGNLPGGLAVKRRAAIINQTLMTKADKNIAYNNPAEWLQAIRQTSRNFQDILKWVSCFALAVNEENAAFGRVVTAPTNGAAGVVPAVLMYHLCFDEKATEGDIYKYLMCCAEIGSIFKKGATISAAMGGCQAEIGVSSAMAAAGLVELLGGNAAKAMMAAEIAMEHHLGMTCDPIQGLVQIPCIERNTMGAIKAITAAQIAMESDELQAKISLGDIVKTMWQTALDMNNKYKETAEGGLAVSVNVAEC